MKTILETDRLILRGWRDEDAASLFEYARDDLVGPAAGWLPHKDVGYSRAVIRTIFARDEVYAICLKDEDEKPIGSIGLTLEGSPERPLEKKSAELGFWVGRPYWGQGIAPEAVREVLRHAFEDLELEKVYCAYFQGNNKSKRVQSKCGFSYHHTNTMCKVIMLGETRIEHYNVLTKSQWRTQKSHIF
jgi:RimJ/RimL family protein N-acetyltransferase